MRKKTLLLVFVLSLLAIVYSVPLAVSGAPGLPPPAVTPSVRHDVSPLLREIPPLPPSQKHQPHPHRLRVLEMPPPIQNFDGLGNADNSLPPDANGDVGPNHYVQWVNTSFAIYTKSGTQLYGPAAGNTLWSGFGGPCESHNDGDPIALYDHLADRWFMSQPAWLDEGPYYQCIALSTTPDPTGSYYRYAFQISESKFTDYPKFGVWPDGYYMTANQFGPGQNDSSAGVVTFERAKMLAGQQARMVYFDLSAVNSNYFGLLPSDLDGPAPPAGTPNYFVQVGDDAQGWPSDRLMIWEFHVNWSTPSASTFGVSGNPNWILNTAPFDSNLCNGAEGCIPQKGVAMKLDPLSEQLMYRVQYRYFGTYQTLVANHTVDVDGTNHAGIRWYELRDSGSGWGIFQQGTYAPDALHRWMGSIAMDRSGDIALGFSVSGKNAFPSIRYAGRLASDPLGTLAQGETTLVDGTGSQNETRWGDYSMMAIDPTDGCTFWYTTEYYTATSNGDWKTRIGSFKFPSCGSTPAAGADLALTNTASADAVNVGQKITYTLTVTNLGPSTAKGVTLTDTLPADVSFASVSPNNCALSGGVVACNLGNLTAGASVTVIIVVTATAAATLTNAASVQSSESDPNPVNNTATAETTVNPPCLGITVTGPSSLTYSPRPTRPARKTVRITVSNNGDAPVTINEITALLGQPFTVTSISPKLPQGIPSRGKKRFSIQTERAAGLPLAKATPPYFQIVMDCGVATSKGIIVQPSPYHLSRIHVELQGDYLNVQAEGTGISSLRLQLFDLSGRFLMDKTSDGHSLTLLVADNSGARLPNGVYFYVVRVGRFHGADHVTEVRKLVILR